MSILSGVSDFSAVIVFFPRSHYLITPETFMLKSENPKGPAYHCGSSYLRDTPTPKNNLPMR